MEVTKIDCEKLKQMIQEATPEYEDLKKRNQVIGISIGLLGIALGLGATLSGIVSNNSKIAAAFGACSATVQAILFAYPVDRRAGLYRVLAARSRNLTLDLEVKQPTEAELKKILEEFKSIQLQAAMETFSPRNPAQTEEKLPGEPASEPDHHSDKNSQFSPATGIAAK